MGQVRAKLGPSWVNWVQVGPSWSQVGAKLGHVGAKLGPSWDHIAVQVRLGVQKAGEMKNIEKPLFFSMVFRGFGALDGTWRALGQANLAVVGASGVQVALGQG